MTLSITHPFVSAVADDADPNEVGPDEWNAGHTITMATARILGRSTAGAGAVEELAEAGFKTLFNLEIGTDTQAYDATLTSIAALGTAADKLAYTTGVDTWAETALTAFARSILDDASEAAFKATVNLEANTDFYAPAGTDVALADGGTGASLADPNADRIMAWDDTAGAVVFMAVADLVAEASPAAGDKYLAYTAEGALVGVDHANLPTGGISNVVEDVTPQLGGALDAQGFDITGGGVITLVEQAAAEADIAGRGQIWVETATPNVLKFTDDAGTDFSVVMTGSASHDGFSDFVANEHIDHSSVTLTAGAGLTGGGTIAASRSFAVTGVLEDINTLGANAADSEFLVGTGAGALAWESGATVRTSLGLAIGTNVQAWDAQLDTWATVTPSANGQSLVAAASYAGMRTLLDLEAGTDFYSTSATDALLVGKQTIWVPAGAMEARVTTAAAASNVIEQGTNLFPLRTMDFDTSADEFAGFAIQMPKGWNEGTVIFQAVWSAASGTGTVIWRLKGGAYDDSLALATALGTGVTVTDTVLTATDVHISPESTAVTLANTPAAEDWVMFEISRDVTDTLGVDARLHGVKIHYTTDALTDD